MRTPGTPAGIRDDRQMVCTTIESLYNDVLNPFSLTFKKRESVWVTFFLIKQFIVKKFIYLRDAMLPIRLDKKLNLLFFSCFVLTFAQGLCGASGMVVIKPTLMVQNI